MEEEAGGAEVEESDGAEAEESGDADVAGGAGAGGVTAVAKPPVSGVRALRPRAGGVAAWSRSESEAEDVSAKLPVKKRARIEKEDCCGEGSSRDPEDGRRQKRGGGGLQGERQREEEGRSDLGEQEDLAHFTVPTVSARGRGSARKGRGGQVQGAVRGGRGAVRGGRGAVRGGRGAAGGRETSGKRLYWFPVRAAGPSPDGKRGRQESEEEEGKKGREEEGREEEGREEGSSDDEVTEDLFHLDNDEETEKSSTDSEIESEEALYKAFKESRKKIVERKRETTRRSRMIVKAAKIMREEDSSKIITEDGGYSPDDDGDEEEEYDGDDEDYLPPQAQPRKSTRGPGRRSFLSLHVR